MDQSSRYYRREYWIKVVQACQNRPFNITAKKWLKELKFEKLSQVRQSLLVVGHDAGEEAVAYV